MAKKINETPLQNDAPDAVVENQQNVWKRGFFMLVFAIFFNLAQTLLVIAAIIQFVSLLLTRKTNETVRSFGKGLGLWLNQVAQFQTMETESMPFPWAKWDENSDPE